MDTQSSFRPGAVSQPKRFPYLPLCHLALLLAWGGLAIAHGAEPPGSLREHLRALPFKIVCESYVDHNWELIAMSPDGGNPVNLTASPSEHEHYPQVSADGRHVAYVVDRGEGRDAVRSLWVMDVDGRNRRKLADYARQPFWGPDSQIVGYLPQEYPKFNVIDFFTKGMVFYDLAAGSTTAHPNSSNLFHLYNPNFSPNGKWIVSTVHAGMGVDHGILLIEAHGPRILNLKIPGCRPCLSPDGRQIAWGAGDHEIEVAPLDTTADTPVVGPWRLHIKDDKDKIYHVDWSPDSRYLCFSRGPDGEGDLTQPGTFQAACEIVGVHAKGWNLCVVSAERDGTLDLNAGNENDFVMLTTNGNSNKEPAWFRATPAARP